jgi:hypothetical protein
MAQFRMRIHLEQGQKGIRLASLASLAGETQKFLRMVGEDVGVEGLQSDWIATDFKNGSLSFNVESMGTADEDQVVRFRHAVSNISSYEPQRQRQPAGIRSETIVQFAKIPTVVDAGESLRLGMYSNGTPTPEWVPLTKQHAVGVIEYFEDRTEYQGMVHGIVHSLYKEAEPPYFDVRDISTGQLVKCLFSPELYRQVVAMLTQKDAVVMVAGTIRARRSDRRIDEITVEKMEAAPSLSAEQFEQFFGCAPNLTGGKSTTRYIGRLR